MVGKFLRALACGVVLAACGSIEVTTTGPKQPSLGDECYFQAFSSAPTDDFSEIGTIDVEPGTAGSNIYRNLAEFKAKIEPEVCHAGGDAIWAVANGNGMYFKAIIFKKVKTQPSRIEQKPSSASTGCQFDTQCKGDRVCVAGTCTSPAPN